MCRTLLCIWVKWLGTSNNEYLCRVGSNEHARCIRTPPPLNTNINPPVSFGVVRTVPCRSRPVKGQPAYRGTGGGLAENIKNMSTGQILFWRSDACTQCVCYALLITQRFFGGPAFSDAFLSPALDPSRCRSLRPYRLQHTFNSMGGFVQPYIRGRRMCDDQGHHRLQIGQVRAEGSPVLL